MVHIQPSPPARELNGLPFFTNPNSRGKVKPPILCEPQIPSELCQKCTPLIYSAYATTKGDPKPPTRLAHHYGLTCTNDLWPAPDMHSADIAGAVYILLLAKPHWQYTSGEPPAVHDSLPRLDCTWENFGISRPSISLKNLGLHFKAFYSQIPHTNINLGKQEENPCIWQ